MKIYGYVAKENSQVEELIEISIQASSQEMRKIANFLYNVADEFEKKSENELEHFHFSDYCKIDLSSDEPELIAIHPNLK